MILFILEAIQEENIQSFGIMWPVAGSGLKLQEILQRTKFLKPLK